MPGAFGGGGFLGPRSNLQQKCQHFVAPRLSSFDRKGCRARTYCPTNTLRAHCWSGLCDRPPPNSDYYIPIPSSGAVHRSFHWVSDYLVGPRTWNRLWIRDRALGVDPQATAGTLWRSSPRGVLYALRWLVPGRNCRSCLVGSSEFDQVGGLPHPWGEGHANRNNLRLFKVH